MDLFPLQKLMLLPDQVLDIQHNKQPDKYDQKENNSLSRYDFICFFGALRQDQPLCDPHGHGIKKQRKQTAPEVDMPLNSDSVLFLTVFQ